MADVQTTTLNRSWLLKTGVFMLVLLVFGVWGLIDALWLYPGRGLADASFRYRDFLVAADKAGRLTTGTLIVTDPRAALTELQQREGELVKAAQGNTGEAHKAAMELAKLSWLQSLARAWRLNADDKPLGTLGKPADRNLFANLTTGEGYTLPLRAGAGVEKTVLSPQALHNELRTYWDTTTPVSPLAGYDMPFQWIFVVVGFVGGGWILLTILRASATKFTWDPAAQRLTLPGRLGGASLVPADLEDIDKRLWHKYYVTLVDKSGAHHKLDLLRFEPLEEWVLEMEKTRFPERAAEAERERAAKEQAEREQAAVTAPESAAAGNPTDTDPNN